MSKSNVYSFFGGLPEESVAEIDAKLISFNQLGHNDKKIVIDPNSRTPSIYVYKHTK